MKSSSKIRVQRTLATPWIAIFILASSWLARVASGQPLKADSPQIMTFEQASKQHLLLQTAEPFAPYRAIRNRWEGQGVFDLRFDFETGELREIHIFRSTGHSLLDGYAISALKLWRAKPHAIYVLRVPFNFTVPASKAGGHLRET
jgi:outer membrane biosynthesis protein TonB